MTSEWSTGHEFCSTFFTNERTWNVDNFIFNKWSVSFWVHFFPMQTKIINVFEVPWANFASHSLAFVKWFVKLQSPNIFKNQSAMAFVNFSFVMMLQPVTANKNYFQIFLASQFKFLTWQTILSSEKCCCSLYTWTYCRHEQLSCAFWYWLWQKPYYRLSTVLFYDNSSDVLVMQPACCKSCIFPVSSEHLCVVQD